MPEFNGLMSHIKDVITLKKTDTSSIPKALHEGYITRNRQIFLTADIMTWQTQVLLITFMIVLHVGMSVPGPCIVHAGLLT